MKKLLLLLTVLFTVTFAFANESINPTNSTLNVNPILLQIWNDNSQIVLNNEEPKELKEVICLSVQVSCTSAYTCQEWTPSQWLNWANQIQSNYCTLGGRYVNTLSSGTED